MYPDNVITLLKTAKYGHLATSSKDATPNVTLMNYTYVPGTELRVPCQGDSHFIIFPLVSGTTRDNLHENPKVSLLVHDWTSGRRSSGLQSFLQELNACELSSLSATLNGTAKVLEGDDAEFYREVLRKSNPDGKVFIDNAEVCMVEIASVKVADVENRVETY